VPANPYRNLPDHCFWRRSIAGREAAAVDPVVSAKFTIGPGERIATAGSCFAQHIARYLRQGGFNYLVTEPAHPIVDEATAARFGYGLFTARYGNIYTARQLLQLLLRAYGEFKPVEDLWRGADGRLIDPFRPQIQPDGFASLAEFAVDREQHLAAVRRAVEELDVLVFTLGLTEAWMDREDRAVYPLAPGVAGGTFDERRHAFINFSVRDIVEDLTVAFRIVTAHNPRARFILTVSPVPLAATYENRSVLVSTTYSKSVLRVACEELAHVQENVAYFPSYEIITGNFSRGSYFAEDLRSVTEAGVAHVMGLFMRHYLAAGGEIPAPPLMRQSAQRHEEKMKHVVAVMCDEEALDSVDEATEGASAARGGTSVVS